MVLTKIVIANFHQNIKVVSFQISDPKVFLMIFSARQKNIATIWLKKNKHHNFYIFLDEPFETIYKWNGNDWKFGGDFEVSVDLERGIKLERSSHPGFVNLGKFQRRFVTSGSKIYYFHKGNGISKQCTRKTKTEGKNCYWDSVILIFIATFKKIW